MVGDRNIFLGLVSHYAFPCLVDNGKSTYLFDPEHLMGRNNF